MKGTLSLAGLFLMLSLPAIAQAAGPDLPKERRQAAEAVAAEVTELRSTLAKEFIQAGANVDVQTFKRVCGSVGARARELMIKEGVVIRHAAVKYRNPANAASLEEAVIIEGFAANGSEKGSWDTVERRGIAYHRYSMPIYVEKACLACHGRKEDRPPFILDSYSKDRAYGFSVGELRGIITVLVPAAEKKQ